MANGTTIFVGRDKELARLEAALFPQTGEPGSVAISTLHGMPGLGESFLVRRFFETRGDRFPGGYQRIALRVDDSADAVIDRAARSLGCARDHVADRIAEPRALLHLDDAHTPELAGALSAVVSALRVVVISGRHRFTLSGTPATTIDLGTLSPDQGVELLERAFRPAESDAERRELAPLVRELGYLPVAIELAARALRRGVDRAAYLADLRQRLLVLKPQSLTGTVTPEVNARRILVVARDLLAQANA